MADSESLHDFESDGLLAFGVIEPHSEYHLYVSSLPEACVTLLLIAIQSRPKVYCPLGFL
jgi:hypothetical protein